ncbi:hypothetical protein GCM10010469_01820 [Streptomyces labedae]|uniref:Secreted protein n=1 Tax=Streptomyces labedae TaxID=285569 RepID=A0ABP6QNJ1_9ACTN
MPSVISRATLPPSLRLWAGVLLACALVLCVTGAARSAATTSDGPMTAMHQLGDDEGAARQDSTAAKADDPAMDEPCPTSADHCAQSRAAVAPAAPASAAHAADAPRTVSAVQLGVPRSGVPPSAACASGPPDLQRLCVSRT